MTTDGKRRPALEISEEEREAGFVFPDELVQLLDDLIHDDPRFIAGNIFPKGMPVAAAHLGCGLFAVKVRKPPNAEQRYLLVAGDVVTGKTINLAGVPEARRRIEGRSIPWPSAMRNR